MTTPIDFTAMYEVPLSAQAQKFLITLNNVQYLLTLQYRNVETDNLQSGWTLDIADNQGNSIIAGIPLVTGVDLLGQYQYLGIGGSLYVYTNADPTAAPTYEGLGNSSFIYFVVP